MGELQKLAYVARVIFNFTLSCQHLSAAIGRFSEPAHNFGRLLGTAFVQAISLLQRGARRGYVPALDVLGEVYRNGCGATVNQAEAFRFRKLAAEKGSIVSSMASVAAMLWNSDGVDQDRRGAMERYKKAAHTGDKNVQATLVDEILGLSGVDGIIKAVTK